MNKFSKNNKKLKDLFLKMKKQKKSNLRFIADNLTQQKEILR